MFGGLFAPIHATTHVMLVCLFTRLHALFLHVVIVVTPIANTTRATYDTHVPRTVACARTQIVLDVVMIMLRMTKQMWMMSPNGEGNSNGGDGYDYDGADVDGDGDVEF